MKMILDSEPTLFIATLLYLLFNNVIPLRLDGYKSL